jgi:hypothetical protein
MHGTREAGQVSSPSASHGEERESMMKRISVVMIVLLATIALTIGTASAGVKNGNFEQGDFSRWKTLVADGQVWRLYDKRRSFTPPLNGVPSNFWRNLPDPLSKYSPVIDQSANPGTSNLYRKLKLPKRARKLSLWFYYYNFAGQFNFGTDWSDNTNQYFSIDVLKPKARADTSAPNKILHTLFAPDQGPVQMRAGAAASPQMNRGWTPAEWTVAKRYRGKRVQLRLIVSVFDAPLQTGIDDVRIKKKRKKR